MKIGKSVSSLLFAGLISGCFSCKVNDVGDIYTYEFEFNNNSIFEIADGWCNGGFFDATWRKEQVSFNPDSKILILTLDNDSIGSEPKFKSGEYRTRDFFHYGLYEVGMKVAKGSGIVSSFFTYTGPSDNNPWDEIDIEILGKDPTVMQTNYFSNGVGYKEAFIDLGFDASESFNDYAFEWLPNEINWYVNGNLVHTEDGSKGEIPKTASKIMVNLWPGKNVDGWTGIFNDNILPISAEYSYIKYTPINM